MKKIKSFFEVIWSLMPFIILILIVITYVTGSIQAWVLYGGKPISEVPMWALWFLMPRGGN